MMAFIIGFVVAWLLLGIFFYIRSDVGSWCIWERKWDTILILFPAIPIIFLFETAEEAIVYFREK